MKRKTKLFGKNCAVIGMIHLEALPGTPRYNSNNKEIIKKAILEAQIYNKAGIDAIMLENMHDIPYVKNNVGHEISTLMSIIAYEIKNKTQLPCGIQILAGANEAAIAAAHSAGIDFIRAEGFVFGHLADEGYIDSCAGNLLRYRKNIGAENIKIFTDIKKKHSSHAISSDVNIVETAKAADFFLSDGLIITGTSTGEETNIDEIISVKEVVNKPIIVGSGVTYDNVEKYINIADALIIGSHFKEHGNWQEKVSEKRVRKFVEKVQVLTY